MKNIKLFTVLFLMAFLSGCNDTEDTRSSNSGASLIGTWTMTKSYGGIAAVNNVFADGVITWSFDTQNQILTVVNNNTDMEKDDALDSGIYHYTIVDSVAPESCAKTLQIDGADYGCFIITDNGLTISQAYADGLSYDFTKKM